MANVIRIGGGGAGGSTVTLPPMVTNLKAVGSNATITVTFTNPVSEALAGVMVVYNDDHIPTKPSDGKKFDAGLTQQAVIAGLQNGTEYFIRVYPYNEKKQYQTLIDGATTSATPNIGPAQVTNFQVTGSGSSPVLTWVNPTDDPLYKETVVVQKVDSAPTSITDGTEIYRGTGTTVTASNLVRLEEYYWAVFTVDEGGSYRTPVVSEMYSYDFPDEPTSYSEIEKLYATEQWAAPEDGYFEFIGLAASGRGGDGDRWTGGVTVGGGSGGSGGITVSVFPLNKGDTVSLTIDGNVSISHGEETANAYRGGNGTRGLANSANNANPGDGGFAGSAAGGNITNVQGNRGNDGTYRRSGSDNPAMVGGYPVATSYSGYSTSSGAGAWNTGNSGGGTGTAAYVVVLRGNTNIPEPSTASVLSLTPRNASIEASWINSGDPESVGTLLVSNPTHEPQDITDGTAVDVAEATSYTLTDLPNDKPTYISLFSYNADKSKYSAAKSNVEIPREVTWADTQDALEQDVEEKTEQLTIVTQEYEAEVKTMASAGISQVKAYCEATSNPPTADVGVFASGVDEWKAGVEYKLNDLFTYQGNMGYVKQPTLTSLDVYPPFSVGTEALYGARPKPDADGVYPYVYNMGIYEGMLVRDDGVLYRSITGTQERPTELLYHPKYVPTLLEKVEEGGEEAPSEEYPEWVRPTGAHDAYAQGAKVSHNGKKWTSDIAANVWEPGVYGWTEVI